MSFKPGSFFGSSLYPAEAGKFLLAAGGSWTTTEERALAYLVNNLTDLGIGAVGSNFLIYPFIGGTAARNSLNLFYPTTSSLNITWIGSPTHNSSGVGFNGSSQYGVLPSMATNNLTPNLTTANVSMGFCTSGMGAGTYIPMGFAMAAATQTKTYSTAGNFTFNPNTEAPGVSSFTIRAWGGGGAGGGNTTANWAAGGGSGGNYASSAVTITTPGTDISITVGVGGQANTGATGGNGGDSIVSHPNFSTITAKGGRGGNVNIATAPGGTSTAQAGNAGTTTFNGGTGAAGGANAGRGGGGGGASAGTAANGNAGTTPNNTSGGAGGTAVAGGVAGGAGGAANNAGVAGTAGGGGGGGAGSSTTSRAGGGGGVGKVTIEWTPPVQKRLSMSIFNAGTSNNQLFNADVGGDSTSRFSYQTSPLQLQGVRVGSRRANTGASTDMGFYVQNNAGAAINGPIVMSTTSFNPSPLFYIGAINSWAATNGVGNNAGNLYSGTLNFAFIGPGLSNSQLQAMYNLIVGYNTILGR